MIPFRQVIEKCVTFSSLGPVQMRRADTVSGGHAVPRTSLQSTYVHHRGVNWEYSSGAVRRGLSFTGHHEPFDFNDQ